MNTLSVCFSEQARVVPVSLTTAVICIRAKNKRSDKRTDILCSACQTCRWNRKHKATTRVVVMSVWHTEAGSGLPFFSVTELHYRKMSQKISGGNPMLQIFWLISLVLLGHMICVPNGGGFAVLCLCTVVPQTGWKYHFIFTDVGRSFWGNNLCGHDISVGNIWNLFCNIFFPIFLLSFTCSVEIILLHQKGKTYSLHNVLDVNVCERWAWRKWGATTIMWFIIRLISL